MLAVHQVLGASEADEKNLVSCLHGKSTLIILAADVDPLKSVGLFLDSAGRSNEAPGKEAAVSGLILIAFGQAGQ